MGLSRQQSITTLLVIDSIFFLVEIIAGYTVHSLALVADSFHMLNDVMSLIVALYAVKLAARTNFSSKYSYGWQRAEILGALVNGVFLLALCFSIFIEAIERFFEPREVKNPMLILIVGSAGLASNLIGLALFHEHGHSHGGHSHGPSSHGQPSSETDDSHNHHHDHHEFQQSGPLDEILVHPAQTRQSVVEAAEQNVFVVEDDDDMARENEISGIEVEENNQAGGTSTPSTEGTAAEVSVTTGKSHKLGHHHEKTKKRNLNMHGVFLHVLGDALGNIGVIAAALFIRFTDYSWRFYADPVISLVITCIIFSSALPLVRSASSILLQGVPPGIPIDDVRAKLRRMDGVLSVHELHIWQLSDTKLIASVHVQLKPDTDYMTIAASIRSLLHGYGVHSATIQPEMNNEMIANDVDGHESACLLRCAEDDSCAQNVCCPAPISEARNNH